MNFKKTGVVMVTSLFPINTALFYHQNIMLSTFFIGKYYVGKDLQNNDLFTGRCGRRVTMYRRAL
jgi:hypothetical protein